MRAREVRTREEGAERRTGPLRLGRTPPRRYGAAMPDSPSEKRSDAPGSANSPAAPEGGKKPDRPESPPTPFDHPLFLPILLFAGMLWFGYDGWISEKPSMQEHSTFNRVGFVVLTLATAWYGRSGLRDWKRDQERAKSGQQDGSSD
jgi:hypothetical protein